MPQDFKRLLKQINNPQQYVRFGIPLPKGILMVGPPGTGKTMIARTMAHEANARFYHMAGSEFVELFVGQGARRVRQLFQGASLYTKLTGRKAIIFIDEIDAIGNKRGAAGTSSEDQRTLNELLNQMDGFVQNGKVIVLAATNTPDSIDDALKRAGRFDRIAHVELPDKQKRKQLLEFYMNKRDAAVLESSYPFDQCAEQAEGLNCPDIKQIVDIAATLALEEESKTITQQHLVDVTQDVLKQRNGKEVLSEAVQRMFT